MKSPARFHGSPRRRAAGLSGVLHSLRPCHRRTLLRVTRSRLGGSSLVFPPTRPLSGGALCLITVSETSRPVQLAAFENLCNLIKYYGMKNCEDGEKAWEILAKVKYC